MSTRMRSPNYPGTPLNEAIDIVVKIFRVERTNGVEREDAARAAGYNGLSGRSAKVLADLSQYGLLERTGKSGVRVSRRAVEIMHPDSDASRAEALREAAFEPELFQRIRDRFPDGQPSETALRSYFLKEGFTDGAIQPAIRGYLETCRFIEEAIVSESRGRSTSDVQNLESNQRDIDAVPMNVPRLGFHTPAPQGQSSLPSTAQEAMTFDWPNKRVLISRVISSKQEAEDVIAFINAVLQLLPPGGTGPLASDSKSNEEDANYGEIDAERSE